MLRVIIILSVLCCAGYADMLAPSPVAELEDRIEQLEEKQRNLEHLESSNERMAESRMDKLEDDVEQGVLILFVSATLCSLWAMYTRRSSVLWFFLGFILAPFALIALLWKSGNDLNSGRMKYWD